MVCLGGGDSPLRHDSGTDSRAESPWSPYTTDVQGRSGQISHTATNRLPTSPNKICLPNLPGTCSYSSAADGYSPTGNQLSCPLSYSRLATATIVRIGCPAAQRSLGAGSGHFGQPHTFVPG